MFVWIEFAEGRAEIRRMRIYGHRGASIVEPENTLAAFRVALDMGVDGLEFDVQTSRDCVPVVLHDRALHRTTTGIGNVDECDLRELGAFGAGAGERIPTLDEVLDLVGGRIHLDLEIKQGGIEAETVAVLRRHPVARWSVSSFDWDILARWRTLDAATDLWPLAVDVSPALLDLAARIGASAVALHASATSRASVSALKQAGLDVVVWTVNGIDEARRLQDLGVAGLCTDAPDLIIAGLKNKSADDKILPSLE